MDQFEALSKHLFIAILIGLTGCTPSADWMPLYHPPITPPQWREVASVDPTLPAGRWGIVDRFATWNHRSMVRVGLREGTPVPPRPAARIITNQSKIGHLLLNDGRTIEYILIEDPPDLPRLQLRYPDGTRVSLELPEEEIEDDDEEEEEHC